VASDAGADRIGVAVEAQLDQARRDDDADDRRRERTERERVADAKRRRRGRSSVRMRQSPAPKTTALKTPTSSGASERRPARRTSIAEPLATWRPPRLAGQVAASLATTRSPATRRSASASRRWWAIRPAPSTTSRRASAGRCTGVVAAFMRNRGERIGRRRSGVGASCGADRLGAATAPIARRSRLGARFALLRRAPTVAVAGALAVDAADDLARRLVRPLQRRRVGVGHRGGVQRRVHVARVDGDDGDPVRPSSSCQIRLMWASAALLAP
jgi:hypothetical protein